MLVTKTLKLCADSLCSEKLSVDFFSIQKKRVNPLEAFTTYPQGWIQHYTERGYWKEDPALEETPKNKNGCFWGENSEEEPSQVILEARDFSIRSGFSFETPDLWGNIYTVTISSKNELSTFKKHVTPLEISQMLRYGAILDYFFKADASKANLKKAYLHIKQETEIFEEMKCRQENTLTALNTLRNELSFSAPASILDKTTFLVDYTHQQILDLE